MADIRISVDAFKNKTFENLSKSFADKSSAIDTGSGCAAVGAIACSLLSRAAAMCTPEEADAEKLEYIARNAENLRNYMVFLLDEDTKCRAPLARALSEGGQFEIDACMQSACAITSEIITMMQQLLILARDLKCICPDEVKHYVIEASELAFASAKAGISWILNRIAIASDETYLYVTRRENQVYLQECTDIYEEIING